MTDLMNRAVQAAAALPPAAQDDLARMMLAVSGQAEDVYQLTSEDVAAIRRSRIAAASGEFATDEQVQAHRAKFGS